MEIILDLLIIGGILLSLMAICSPPDLFTALLIYTVLRNPTDDADKAKKRSITIVCAGIVLVSAAIVTALGCVTGNVLSTWAVVLIAGMPSVFAAGIVKSGLDCHRIKRTSEPASEALGRCRKRRTFFIVMTVIAAVGEIVLVYSLLFAAVAYM